MIELTVSVEGGRSTHAKVPHDTLLYTLCGLNLKLREWKFTERYTPTCKKCLALFNRKEKQRAPRKPFDEGANMTEITNTEMVSIGCWYYLCCEEDLAEILTPQDLDDVRRTMRSRDNAPLPLLPRVFRTRSEAVQWLTR